MNDPLPPIDPEDAKAARAVHFKASLQRFMGLAIFLAGLVIALGKMPDKPVALGYVLMAFGLFQILVFPMLVIRRFVKTRQAIEAAKNDGPEPKEDEPA